MRNGFNYQLLLFTFPKQTGEKSAINLCATWMQPPPSFLAAKLHQAILICKFFEQKMTFAKTAYCVLCFENFHFVDFVDCRLPGVSAQKILL